MTNGWQQILPNEKQRPKINRKHKNEVYKSITKNYNNNHINICVTHERFLHIGYKINMNIQYFLSYWMCLLMKYHKLEIRDILLCGVVCLLHSHFRSVTPEYADIRTICFFLHLDTLDWWLMAMDKIDRKQKLIDWSKSNYCLFMTPLALLFIII